MASEPKFKPGMQVWHLTQGMVTLEAHSEYAYPLQCRDRNGLIDTMTADGRIFSNDPYPIILTLEEARRRGFPVPKPKLKVDLKVDWCADDRNVFPIEAPSEDSFHWTQLAGKRGRLTFEEE